MHLKALRKKPEPARHHALTDDNATSLTVTTVYAAEGILSRPFIAASPETVQNSPSR